VKRLIAEFEEQDFIQMVFPHEKTDWKDYLDEAIQVYINIIDAIRKYQKVLLVCVDVDKVKKYFKDEKNIKFVKYETNDTWARDISAISIKEDNKTVLYDFRFNAWGGKFEYEKDNNLTQAIKHSYDKEVKNFNFILEGGAIESNGDGVLLTTSRCMLNQNRNKLSKREITSKLKEFFGLKEVLYLNHGFLAGDDTDSHIDTLARFVSKDTIMYIKCEDEKDEHYIELKKMENELKEFAKKFCFNLIELPFCDAIYFEDERLPATYANFLILNDAVLVPTYNVCEDKKALEIFKSYFKDKDVIGVDCSVIIRQHGSLHCITMQFSK
jgi:agmatine/peptidylarginine deiminase